MRASRFGVPLVAPAVADPALAEKLDKRQQRFGKVAPDGEEHGAAPRAALSAEEQAKLDERKKRFGDVQAEPARAGKRVRADGSAAATAQPAAAAKPTAAAAEMSAEMKAKLEERAKKFGLNKAGAVC